MVKKPTYEELEQKIQELEHTAFNHKIVEESLRTSETKYKLLADNTVDCIWLLNMDLVFTYINPAIYEMAGFTTEEWIGSKLQEHSDKHHFEEMASVVLSALNKLPDNSEFQYEGVLLKKNGDPFHVEITGKILLDEKGTPVGLHGVTRDITERKRSEEALRASEEKYRLITENTADLISILDMNLRFTYVSPASVSLRGFTVEEAMEQTLDQVLTPESLRLGLSIFEKEMQLEVSGTADPGRTRILELEEYKKDGSTIWVEVSLSFLRDKDQKPVEILIVSRDISKRKAAEEKLLSESEFNRLVIENVGQGICVCYGIQEFPYVYFNVWNEFMTSITGYSMEEINRLGWYQSMYPDPEVQERAIHRMQSMREGDDIGNEEWEIVRADGQKRQILITTHLYAGNKGEPYVLGVMTDITERKRSEEEKAKLEAQFHQAQKMESVGRLAGGMAHDFNNMLSVVLGFTELAMEKVDPSKSLFRDLAEIRKAASRSSDLTQQLLAFARKQTITPKILDLNETVAGMIQMLRRLIGTNIDLIWKPGRDLWQVMVDPSQLDQILANLCVNARDAIADVGEITIETKNVVLDKAFCAGQPGLVPGEYLQLKVSDSGNGIDKETLKQIFEPFFTTKKMGKGTGLGLATVYGIVKQNSGFINAYSESGQGATFTIYLPRHASKALQMERTAPAEPVARGHETILLVEDEPAILKMATKMLEIKGYTVLVASTPGEAIRLARENPGEIQLLMTDIVMPEMNGRDLAKNLLSLYPDLKCLFMSGYTADIIAHRGVLEDGVQFLQKPFSINDLASKVREALDQKQSE